MTLGTESISRLLIQYSVLTIIASVVTSLYNIIDSIFIGRGVGAMAISGLAITFPLMNLVIAFCTLIAVGGATISSIFMGQKDISRATDVVNNVLLLCIIQSVVFGGITLLFLDEILYFFGATPSTIDYAREFMEVILLGTPIAYVFIGLNNLMRANGYPRKAMVSALFIGRRKRDHGSDIHFRPRSGNTRRSHGNRDRPVGGLHLGARPLHVTPQFHPFQSAQQVVHAIDSTPHICNRHVTVLDECVRLYRGGVHQQSAARLWR